MGLIGDIMRSARRVEKARAALSALTFDEKGLLAAELLCELRAGPPKPRRHRKPKPEAAPAAPAKPKTARQYVTEALASCAPLNVAGIHAAVDRVAPGAVQKATIAAEVSAMLGKGLLVKAGTDGRTMSVALANGGGAGSH